MEANELRELIEKTEASNRKKNIFMTVQLILTLILTVACVTTVFFVIGAASSITDITEEAKRSIDSISTISDELAAANLTETINNINDLAITSQNKITEAAEKIDKLDIDELNSAIKNLSDTVEPLAKFFNIFQK